MPGHVILLGDSVFDNGAYTSGGPDVITQLGRILPPDWTSLLLALDGSVISDLGWQLLRLPSDASHLVISIGGNDVLINLDVLDLRVRSSAEALLKLGQRIAGFERGYRDAIARAIRPGRETILCTIYNGNLDSPEASEASGLPDPAVARVGLTAFNDVILRVAFELLPSVQGGEKIARAITHALGLAESQLESSRIFY